MSSRPLVLLLFLLLLLLPSSIPTENNGGQWEEESGGFVPREQARPRHRWRRAPAVWGEPAPDYSMAALDHGTHIYLYALLFVDLKTSDHYRREHGLVKREVMRLAREANNYFFQINLRLVVVDVLETFRDDLSLYSFEQYRNQRMGQLPFHNFAVLITFRYAGGLAFVGAMCSPKSVMLAGFYPHNPEAMGSIFFHEVAHLIGVPHQPANESMDVPNCSCPRQPSRTGTGQGRAQEKQPRATSPTGVPISKSSLILENRGQPGTGCLKIPGFDQDCSLQLMVNLAFRTRCLAREPRLEQASLPLCGNGLREGNELCDCGLPGKCVDWNCEPYSCSLRWPSSTIWMASIGMLFLLGCLLVLLLMLLLLWLHPGRFLPSWPSFQRFPVKRRPLRFFSRLPLGHSKEANISAKFRGNSLHVPRKIARPANGTQMGQSMRKLFSSLLEAFRGIWKGQKKRRRRSQKQQFVSSSLPSNNSNQIRRPIRPPPPPPSSNLIRPIEVCSPNSTLIRPKRPPPPLPPPPTPKPAIIRPKMVPPAPPPPKKPAFEEEEEEEEDEWDDYCE